MTRGARRGEDSPLELPGAVVERLLGRWPVARLATVGSDGRPHQVPIAFARSADRLWTPVDGKPKREGELVRVRNARRDPRVSLLLDHYAADWTRLWWLRVDGDAEVLTPSDPERDPVVAAALAALRRKYPQYAQVSALRGRPTLLAISVRRLRSWCAGPDAIPTCDDEAGR